MYANCCLVWNVAKKTANPIQSLPINHWDYWITIDHQDAEQQTTFPLRVTSFKFTSSFLFWSWRRTDDTTTSTWWSTTCLPACSVQTSVWWSAVSLVDKKSRYSMPRMPERLPSPILKNFSKHSFPCSSRRVEDPQWLVQPGMWSGGKCWSRSFQGKPLITVPSQEGISSDVWTHCMELAKAKQSDFQW